MSMYRSIAMLRGDADELDGLDAIERLVSTLEDRRGDREGHHVETDRAAYSLLLELVLPMEGDPSGDSILDNVRDVPPARLDQLRAAIVRVVHERAASIDRWWWA